MIASVQTTEPVLTTGARTHARDRTRRVELTLTARSSIMEQSAPAPPDTRATLSPPVFPLGGDDDDDDIMTSVSLISIEKIIRLTVVSFSVSEL